MLAYEGMAIILILYMRKWSVVALIGNVSHRLVLWMLAPQWVVRFRGNL